MEILLNNLPIFIPIILLQLILSITACIHVLQHPQYRFGNAFFWVVIVLFIQFIGPILYFSVGRGETQ